jgi:hypothetical protein
MAEGGFRGKPGEAIAFDDAGTGKPEVFVDNDDLLRRPAKCRRPGGQGVLNVTTTYSRPTKRQKRLLSKSWTLGRNAPKVTLGSEIFDRSLCVTRGGEHAWQVRDFGCRPADGLEDAGFAAQIGFKCCNKTFFCA